MEKNIQTMVDHLLKLLICSLLVLTTQVNGVFFNVTLLHSAVSKGAVCLDGSPPGYVFDKGFGTGANNWLVYIEGGAWCNSTSDCMGRAKTMFGSSFARDRIYFSGALDQNKTFNPEFYNWNKVYVIYCDGASFMADIEEVDPKTNLTFRGARIFDVVMEELLAMGMKNANNAILSGCSAGGLTTILHCDKFRSLIPNANRVKCISDSGFFIRA
ncbi:protein notum homolog [Phtheirospermum japonicum]|uniref:Pectin acetylesterase n=1 Tax=Phtheirospermum japonicum TaxID=374723 RepID=A0A830BAZ5_9LAMI|nr:protein notum homolog [Phtheirospermum japonicum]